MSLSIFPVQIVAVVCGHQRDGQFLRKFFEDAVYLYLLGHLVCLYFKVKTVLVKDGGELPCLLFGYFDPPCPDMIGDNAFQAG